MATYKADKARDQVSVAILESFDQHVADIAERGGDFLSVIIINGIPVVYNISGGAL